MSELPSAYSELLAELERVFHVLASRGEQPRPVRLLDDFVYRYESKSIESAIIQKLARVLSGLHALFVLFRAGLFQEVGVMFRILDELQEDICFLCIPLCGGERSKVHAEYLENFYQEEFDNPRSPLASTQKRDTVPRKKIHAALARHQKNVVNPSDGQELHRTTSQAFSGFVHAASGHILEMYDGERFSVSGMPGGRREAEFAKQVPHYIHRGVAALVIATGSLGSHDLLAHALKLRQHLEQSVKFQEIPDLARSIRDLRRGEQ